jgi:predicted HicB family RNase H-like nuclease
MNKNLKKEASRYVKNVEWSDEDNCFVGRCPELFHGGTHGDDEVQVYADLCAIVEDVLEGMEAKKEAPPAPKIQKSYSGKFVLRTGKELHKALAIKAQLDGKSLNEEVLNILQAFKTGVTSEVSPPTKTRAGTFASFTMRAPKAPRPKSLKK